MKREPELSASRVRSYCALVRKAESLGWELTPVADGQTELIEERGCVSVFEEMFLVAIARQAKGYIKEGKVAA